LSENRRNFRAAYHEIASFRGRPDFPRTVMGLPQYRRTL
jgi:hypothetical protein